MEETTNKSGVSAGMVTIIVIIVAIIFGGGAYAYVNNKATKEKKDLNAQITQLQSQVAASETTATTTTTTPSSTTSATTTTGVTDNETTICNQLFSNSKIGSLSDDTSAKVGNKYCSLNKISTVYATGGICTATESGASGDALGCPGAQWLAKKTNGKWAKLVEGQDAFSCDVLKENNFPKSLLGNDGSCVNSAGSLEQYSN